MKRFCVLFAGLLGVAIMTLAHGDEIHVMGTVSKIDGAAVTVKVADGSTKSVVLDSETKFLKNKADAKREDLKVGDRVAIHAKEVNGTLHATEVKIGVASKPASFASPGGISAESATAVRG